MKGTLYLYFPTKQDLFASILVEEMEAWWAALARASPRQSPGADLSEGLADRGLLVRLLSSLHMNIEPGLSPGGLRALKAWFRDFAARATSDLERRYPDISGRGFSFLLGVYALAVGASQLAFPPESVRALIAAEETLAPFRVDFREFFSTTVDALYRGTRAREGDPDSMRSE